MRKIFTILLAAGFLNFSVPQNFTYNLASAQEVYNITDVKPKHWAYPAIKRIVNELGIMKPKYEEHFVGGDLATRYEVANAFYVGARKLEFTSGLDLKMKEIRPVIEIKDLDSENNNVVNAIVNTYGLMQVMEGNRFMGNKKITRYELAYELDNYLGMLERTVGKTSKIPINRVERLVDVKQSHWAYNAIKNVLNKYQIMSGYPDNEFKGGRTLTRYELVAVLKKFVDYIDKYLIYIPKYIPLPDPIPTPIATPIPVPTPMPTPVPTPVPTPIPTVEPLNKTPLPTFDGKVGIAVKAAYPEGIGSESIGALIGPSFEIAGWFPKVENLRFGADLSGYFINYGNIFSNFFKVNNLRRMSISPAVNWRILGADYLDDISLSFGVGYEYMQWAGASYNYSNHGPKGKLSVEVPLLQYFSVFLDNNFSYFISQNSSFTSDLNWKNELFLGVNIPYFSPFSAQIGYRDTRYSLSGKSEIYGDVGGTAHLRMRF
jgi:hypothetical protein